MADHENPQVSPKVRQGAAVTAACHRGADGYDVPRARGRKPIWAVRALGVSAVIVGCTVYSANAATDTDPTPARAAVEQTPEKVMAEHDCGPHVNLMDAAGVVVSRNGPTYLAGPEAIGRAYNERATTLVYGFCAR